MVNQIILVGRIVYDVEVKTLDDGKRVAEALLAVRRPFKNQEGNYDTDFIKINLWEGLAEAVSVFLKKGTLIAIKGRLQIRRYDIDEDRWLNINEVVAERVTYLASPRRTDEETRFDDESS